MTTDTVAREQSVELRWREDDVMCLSSRMHDRISCGYVQRTVQSFLLVGRDTLFRRELLSPLHVTFNSHRMIDNFLTKRGIFIFLSLSFQVMNFMQGQEWGLMILDGKA